jgi:hypothetical protein
MTVYRNEGKYDKSNIEFENGKIVKYDKKVVSDKMKYIDYGLGILTSNAFADFTAKMNLILSRFIKIFSAKMICSDMRSKKDFMR